MSALRGVRGYRRELAPAIAFAALLAVVAVVAPGFFSAANLRDLVLNNVALLITAVGMTLIILAGEIDISVASLFAACSVAAGVLAKAGLPIPLLLPTVVLTGAAMGALNGLLIGWLRLPSIIVTLGMMVAWRDALRWVTQGAWVQELPPNFQWFGLGQTVAQWLIVFIALAVLAVFGWMLSNLRAGRAIYAVGSDAEAARLAGIEPRVVIFGVFVVMGGLVGLAALLNAIRFSAVPANLGLGLELEAIAAVVVGGTAITGGRGRMVGTLIGVALLGTIGTALTFLGINPFWERAIQGAIILAALGTEVVLGRMERYGEHVGGVRAEAR
ncbi:MAG TPA: ABC transporter permease [Longimicrobiales bacterium]|nr:ABC transporter permease [Longimicrobiales bacterium]